MKEKQKFVCSYCGAEYDDAPARARCELECDEKRKQEAARRRRESLDHERDVRYKEIYEKNEHLNGLIKKYNEDYGALLSIPHPILSSDMLRNFVAW